MTTHRNLKPHYAEPKGKSGPVIVVKPCRWSYANSMSFAFCETHGDYHRSFLTPPTVCATALSKSEASW
jgi:hypothetical protein